MLGGSQWRWLALTALGVGCTSTAPAPVGTVGSTVAVLADGHLAVVNPDQGSVSFVDSQTLAVLGTVPVGGDPRALLQLRSGAVWVATHGGGSVCALDPAAMAVGTCVSPCSGPLALAEAPDGSAVAVACEWSGSVVRLNPTTLAATTWASGLIRPRGLAWVGSSVAVAEFTTGNVVTIGPDGGTTTLSLVPSGAAYRPELTQMTANLASAVVPAFGGLVVPHELVNHTGTSTDETEAADYGSAPDGNPKINAAVTQLTLAGEVVSRDPATPPVYSQFDLPEHEFCGATAVATFGSHFVLVAHISTNDVAVLDTTATDPSQRLVATYSVGAGPSGLAVDAARQVAYVDNAFDGSISILDLTQPHGTPAPSYAPTLTLVRDLASPYSTAALAGRTLFYDATNPHVTPARVVACATCHPGGTDDGLVWFVHTPVIPLKRRRTPSLVNSSSDTAPFHWDGSFANMTLLTNGTITDLMAGDDLLVDATVMQAFVDEMVLAPVPPPQDPGAVARGQALFASASTGCATCHLGPNFTDNLDHAVLDPMSLTSDDVFTTANTPDLHALFERAPFFHDGRSPNLLDLLTRPDAAGHGSTSGLSQSQLSDLVAYLNSL